MHVAVSCQTESDNLKDEYEKIMKEFVELKKEHKELLLKYAEKEAEVAQLQVKVPCDEDDFRYNDKKVLFFTGLTDWDILSKLFNFVRPYLVGHLSLTPFQQLMVTLMRLRLGSSNLGITLTFTLPLFHAYFLM